MKNQGSNSKKVARRNRATVRQQAFAKLSPAEQAAQKAQNKAEYDAQHPRQ